MPIPEKKRKQRPGERLRELLARALDNEGWGEIDPAWLIHEELGNEEEEKYAREFKALIERIGQQFYEEIRNELI